MFKVFMYIYRAVILLAIRNLMTNTYGLKTILHSDWLSWNAAILLVNVEDYVLHVQIGVDMTYMCILVCIF